jgi:hypothetical protein
VRGFRKRSCSPCIIDTSYYYRTSTTAPRPGPAVAPVAAGRSSLVLDTDGSSSPLPSLERTGDSSVLFSDGFLRTGREKGDASSNKNKQTQGGEKKKCVSFGILSASDDDDDDEEEIAAPNSGGGGVRETIEKRWIGGGGGVGGSEILGRAGGKIKGKEDDEDKALWGVLLKISKVRLLCVRVLANELCLLTWQCLVI